MPKRLERVVSKEEFFSLLRNNRRIIDFFRLGNLLQNGINRNVYYHLGQKAEEAEDFFDNYTNVSKTKTFQYPRELIAGIKWFCKAAFEVDYLLGRIDSYNIDKKEFIPDAKDNLNGYHTKICLIFNAIKTFFYESGIGIKEKAREEETKGKEPKYIVRDEEREEEVVESQEEHLEKMVLDFLNASETARKLTGNGAEKISESEITGVKEEFHKIKTEYDSHISNTKYETSNPGVMRIRDHAAICEHLSEISKDMIHFYERHENVVRRSETKEKIARFIGPLELICLADNFSLPYARKYAEDGNEVCKEIIKKKDNLGMIVKCELFCKGEYASRIWKIVDEYKLKVFVGDINGKNETEVTITSPINVMCGLYSTMIEYDNKKDLEERKAKIRIEGDDPRGLVEMGSYLRKLRGKGLS